VAGLRLRKPEPFDPPEGSYLLAIGEQRFVGKLDRIWLTPGHARAHMLVLGQTNSGKTKLLEAICRQYVARGQPFCLVDLHGDLATSLRMHIAALPQQQRDAAAKRLVWLDAADPERTATFNPLAAAEPADAATQLLELVAAFRRHWSDSWGPRLADLLHHSLATLQANGLTLAEAPVLLGDKPVRQTLLRGERVPEVTRDYFRFRFDALSRRDQVFISESSSNKLGALLSDFRVRTLLGDPHATFSAREALKEGQMVLARIPRGALVENADLVASMLLAAVHTAALARVSEPPERRRPFVLILDEAQVASTETFPQLLAGARAFGLSAICGVQYLEQLPRGLAEALLANCRVLVCFKVGRRDADRMARELFAADGDHVKFIERDLLGSRKSRPMFWSVGEEREYHARSLQDQLPGECVIQLGTGMPWFAESIAVEPPEPSKEGSRSVARAVRPRLRSRAAIEEAIANRRERLQTQPLTTTQKGGDSHDPDDAVEALA